MYEMLNLNVFSTYAIEKPPVRGNISYQFAYLNKETPLDSVFGYLIEELKLKGEKTDRCIIFCQTRKQCATVYRLFSAILGKGTFATDHAALVQMFHAGSPDSVKNHVVKEMTNERSNLRVLICTIAFGMGIDCKNVHRSIHFGPSNTVESLVQETGRLGRDGLQCFCYILFNGMLSAHCDTQIKELLGAETCRRNLVEKLFPSGSSVEKPKGCLCCDLCSKNCDCSQHNKISMLPFQVTSDHQMSVQRTRPVSEIEKSLLYGKLLAYRNTLLPSSTNEFIPIGSTAILHDFDHYHINQMMKKCDQLFNMQDIVRSIELWRNTHANNVYLALSGVFGDMDDHDCPLLLSEEDFEDMDVVEEGWENIRDDSSRADLFDESKFEGISRMTEEDRKKKLYKKNKSL